MRPLNLDVLAVPSLNVSISVAVKEGMIPREFRGRKIEAHHISIDQNRQKFRIYVGGKKPLRLDMHEGFMPNSAGSSYNVAIGLKKLGRTAGIMGAIGNDMFASQLSESLSDEHIPLMAIDRGMGTPVTLSCIEENSDHALTTLFNYKQAYDLPINKALQLLNGVQYRFVLATGVRSSELELLTRLFTLQPDNFLVPNEKVCESASDANVQVLLKLTNIVQVNFEEAQVFSNCTSGDLEEMARTILAMGPKVVIITRDVKGVFVGRLGKSSTFKAYEQAAFPASVVDNDGAGDGFSVGFVYSLLSKLPISKCLEVGTWVAARNIEKVGGYGGMPTYEEVAEILK